MYHFKLPNCALMRIVRKAVCPHLIPTWTLKLDHKCIPGNPSELPPKSAGSKQKHDRHQKRAKTHHRPDLTWPGTGRLRRGRQDPRALCSSMLTISPQTNVTTVKSTVSSSCGEEQAKATVPQLTKCLGTSCPGRSQSSYQLQQSTGPQLWETGWHGFQLVLVLVSWQNPIASHCSFALLLST